jgi:TM2 domain-containing membrane protein YozV
MDPIERKRREMEEKAAQKQAAMGEDSIRDGAKRPSPDERECPRCAETIKAKAKMCRFCQLDLTEVDAAAEGRELLDELGIGDDDDDDDAGDLSWKTHKRKQKRSKNRKKDSKSPSRWDVTVLLCFFFGLIGAHRFYTGHAVVGFIQLLTFGGLFVWTLTDFLYLLMGDFKDAEGRSVTRD